MWHVSSRSGVATLRTAIHLLLTYLLTYLDCKLLYPYTLLYFTLLGLLVFVLNKCLQTRGGAA